MEPFCTWNHSRVSQTFSWMRMLQKWLTWYLIYQVQSVQQGKGSFKWSAHCTAVSTGLVSCQRHGKDGRNSGIVQHLFEGRSRMIPNSNNHRLSLPLPPKSQQSVTYTVVSLATIPLLKTWLWCPFGAIQTERSEKRPDLLWISCVHRFR